jgi:predicted PurR-regulated permease PerM
MFILLVLAILMSYTLSPIVGWLQARRIPRLVATVVVMAAVASAIVAGSSVLARQGLALVEEVPQAARHLREQWRASRQQGGVVEKLDRAAAEVARSSEELSGAPGKTTAAVQPTGFDAGSFFLWGSVGLVSVAMDVTVVFFMVFFMLLSGDLFKRKLLKIAGATSVGKSMTLEVLDEIDGEIKRYLLVRLLTTVAVGVATWAALAWVGLEHALIWGLIAGIFNVVPYLGPVIVSGGLALVGYLQFGTIGGALGVAAIALVITALEGWLLDPPLMGKVERLNAVAVLVGLLFWTAVWGAWGALLAVPMISITKTICDRVEPMKPIGELLGE